MQASSNPTGVLRLVMGLLKAACILAGLPLTLLCLMAAAGVLSHSGWVRGIAALAVGLAGPLLLADRLLPDGHKPQTRGLVTDVLALCWMVLPVAFTLLSGSVTRPLLAAEGDRLAASGWELASGTVYWMAGVRAESAPPAPVGTGTAAGPGKDGGVPAPDAGKAGPRPDSAADRGRAPDLRAASSPDAGKAGPDAAAQDSGGGAFSPAELFRRCAPSVVSVEAQTALGRGGGTGFVIDDQGTVATNSHVVNGAEEVQVKLKDGSWVRRVELLLEDEEADLALLRLHTTEKVQPLPLGDSDRATVGEQVVSIGNPLGLEHTLTDGLVSARRVFGGKNWIQMSAPVSPGNSGGPLFNMKGEVIGVTTRVVAWGMAQNLNLAIPVNELKKRLAATYPDRRHIGADKPQSW